MPNWCDNIVNIKANATTIKEIKEYVAGYQNGNKKDFLLNSIIPMAGDWDYGWCVNNWGTKWEVEARLAVEEETSLIYSFDSAWSPPELVIAELAHRFPNCTIRHAYDEPGMDFGGYTIYNNGEEVCREEGQSHSMTWEQMSTYPDFEPNDNIQTAI